MKCPGCTTVDLPMTERQGVWIDPPADDRDIRMSAGHFFPATPGFGTGIVTGDFSS